MIFSLKLCTVRTVQSTYPFFPFPYFFPFLPFFLDLLGLFPFVFCFVFIFVHLLLSQLSFFYLFVCCCARINCELHTLHCMHTMQRRSSVIFKCSKIFLPTTVLLCNEAIVLGMLETNRAIFCTLYIVSPRLTDIGGRHSS